MLLTVLLQALAGSGLIKLGVALGAAIAAIAAELAQAGSSIVGVNLEDDKNAAETLHLTVQVRSRLHLMHIMRGLRHLSTVTAVARKLDGDKRLVLPAGD